MKIKNMYSVVYAVAVLLLAVLSCKEEFPPYEDPERVLSGQIIVDSPDTVEVYFDGLTSRYYLNTVIALKVEVTNIHDDLLQGKARVGGKIVLQSFAQVSRTAIVPLTSGNLRTPTLFHGNIALGPSRKAEFSELWLPYGTDGKIVFDGLPFATVGNAQVYGPISFIALAEVQLFERVQPIATMQIQFRLTFKVITL